MNVFYFKNWSEALAAAAIPPATRQSHRIVIQWYLGWLKQRREPATLESAREFVAAKIEEKKPREWVVERWRETLFSRRDAGAQRKLKL